MTSSVIDRAPRRSDTANDIVRGMAALSDIVEMVESRRRERKRIVVGISGYAGSGKSTLSRRLMDHISSCVRLRGDDFLDPVRSHQRSSDWDGVDRTRMGTEAIAPFRRREQISYRPLDWATGTVGPALTLPDASVLLVDSIGIFHPELAACFDLRIWVDVTASSALRQGMARDRVNGHDHDRLWTDVWEPNDRDFTKNYLPKSSAEVCFVPEDC